MNVYPSYDRIDDPKKAVVHLRKLVTERIEIPWTLVEQIAGIHFLDTIPRLREHLKHKNDTGLATLFEEEARRLTDSLVDCMTSAAPVSSTEAEMRAFRITLLRTLTGNMLALNARERTPA